MARQCPRGHNGIEPEEDADDTSTQQQAHQDQAPPCTRPRNSRASSRSPWPESRTSEANGMQTTRTQTSRSRGQAEPPSPDLSIGQHLGGGDRRSSSESSVAVARRHSRQVSRERGEEPVSEGGRRRQPVGIDRATGLARPVSLAPTGRPGPTSGPGMAVRERGGGSVFNQKIKNRN
jgi:hypothetical protein